MRTPRCSGSTSRQTDARLPGREPRLQRASTRRWTGPYNVGLADTRPNWVERFPCQNGLDGLVPTTGRAATATLTTTTCTTRATARSSRSTPVPAPVKSPHRGAAGRPRRPFDATFGQEKTDKVTFHRTGVPATVESQTAIPAFVDLDKKKY